MKRLAAALLILAAATPARAETLPLKRVILSTSGLVHFEHAGQVAGDADLDLELRVDQVDDFMKSLVVFDPAGALSGVRLPGRAPLSQTFRDLPFSQGDLASPVTLLNALQGTEVKIAGPAAASGKLIQVVPEESETETGTVTRHRISLLTAQGLRTVLLEDLDSLTFADPKVQDQVSHALAELFRHRAAEQRKVEIALSGKGARQVGFGYVLEAPLWKSAYRLVLPREGDKGFLQGWAILENQTSADWKDVELTLIAGNPVTWRQALYTSYYVSRPALPVEVMGRIQPRIDTGVVGALDDMRADEQQAAGKAAMLNFRRGAMAEAEMMEGYPAPAAAPMPMMAMDMPVSAGAMAGAAMAATGEEATAQVLYRFPQKISLAAGESLMLPFVSADMPAEKIWLYQPETSATHPLAAVRLRNDGSSGLPPGILTLYQRGDAGSDYVGDAQLPVLPKGDDRLVSFALDTRTQIDRKERGDQSIGAITIAEGVLKLEVKQRAETIYSVKAPADEARTVLIEHPRRPGWELVQPDAKDVEVTENHYRMTLKVEPGKSAALSVVMERPSVQSIGLAGLNADQLEARAASLGEIDPRTRKIFTEMAGLRRDLARAEERLRAIEAEQAQIFADQSRLRDNLRAVPNNSDVGKLYLEKLAKQESALLDIEKRRDGAQDEIRDARAALHKFIGEVKL